MKDYVIKATSGNGEIRAYVGNTREMVEQARINHNTTKVATAALGRTLTATSMMGLMMKNEKDELTVIIKGGGHKQLVPGEDRPRRRAERKGQRPVHQQVGIAPDG